MRDIRGDLQERANMFEQQINAAQNQFEKLIEQMQREKNKGIGDLNAELDAVNRVMKFEQRRLRPTSVPESQPQQPLADFLMRALTEVGPMSIEDLCRLAVHEGYFADGESAQQGVHVLLMHVLKEGHLQQLPNARFALAMVPDATKLRRAI